MVLLIIIWGFTYTIFKIEKENYSNIVKNLIQSKINYTRDNIVIIENTMSNLSKHKERYFRKIHMLIANKLKEKPDTDIEKLQQSVKEQLSSEFIDLHIYLINKEMIVYNTTYKPDLNLDMSIFKGASIDIQNAKKNADDIIIAIPSIDVLERDYRIYSYSSLYPNDEIVLEVGFFDTSITQIQRDLLYKKITNPSSLIKDISLFADYKTYVIDLYSKENYEKIAKKDFFKVNQKLNAKLSKIKEKLKN